MSYEKKVSRANPGLIIMILDDSGSMSDPLPGTSDAKYMWVERYTGLILEELLARSTEVKGGGNDDEAIVKPRYFLYLIIYGSKPRPWSPNIIDIEEAVIKYTEAQGSLGLGGKMGGTYTREAFEMALNTLKKELKRFKACFPPMVFHLTDGLSHTDAEPFAKEIMNMTTDDGNLMVVNAFIGTQTALSYNSPEDYPGYVEISEVGATKDNHRLFKMSSVMPEVIRMNLIEDRIFPNVRQGARLFFDVRTKDMLKHTIQVVGSQSSRMIR